MVSVCQTGRARHEPNHDSGTSPIPDIETFEERVAIHIHRQGGIPTDQAKDLAAQARAFAIRRTTGHGSGSMWNGRGWGNLNGAGPVVGPAYRSNLSITHPKKRNIHIRNN